MSSLLDLVVYKNSQSPITLIRTVVLPKNNVLEAGLEHNVKDKKTTILALCLEVQLMALVIIIYICTSYFFSFYFIF